MEAAESPSELIRQANSAFVSEDYAEAAELYTKAIQIDDSKSEYYVNRAHALQKLERYTESKADAQKAIDLNPSDPKAYLRKGIACFHLQQYEEAQEAFQASSTHGGNDAGIRQWLTWTEEKLLRSKKTPVTIKHDWYQTESHVCVTVLAKNLSPDSVSVQFAPSTMMMKAKLPDGTDYELNLNLSFPIVPEQSSHTVMKTKVEIKMKKCDGIRWSSLEGQALVNVKQIPVAIPELSAQPPVYPSSSAKKKNWDKIESEIKKEEAEEKPEGEAALNQLFQKIYGEGSDEIRRAMNKSFQESGGTVLSTNWNEVSKDKVTVKPPDGVEFKKWDE